MYRVLVAGFSSHACMHLGHSIPDNMDGFSVRYVADLDQADAVLKTGLHYRLLIVSLDSKDLQSLAALQRLRKKYIDLTMFALVDPETDMAGALSTIGDLLRNIMAAKHVPHDSPPESQYKRVSGFSPEVDVDHLTPRQRTVLGFMTEGRSNKEIGRKMNITESTVKAHCMAIFRVLGVSSRTQAVLVARPLDKPRASTSSGRLGA